MARPLPAGLRCDARHDAEDFNGISHWSQHQTILRRSKMRVFTEYKKNKWRRFRCRHDFDIFHRLNGASVAAIEILTRLQDGSQISIDERVVKAKNIAEEYRCYGYGLRLPLRGHGQPKSRKYKSHAQAGSRQGYI